MEEERNLSQRLESKGWRFVENRPLFRIESGEGWQAGDYVSEALIIKDYQAGYGADVRLEQAYDERGNPLPRNRYVGVYVKTTKK